MLPIHSKAGKDWMEAALSAGGDNKSVYSQSPTLTGKRKIQVLSVASCCLIEQT